jgi:hypothetical protein
VEWLPCQAGVGPWPTRHWRFLPVMQPGPRGGDSVIGEPRLAPPDASIPLGKLHSTGPLLSHARFCFLHLFPKIVAIMSQRKRSGKSRPKSQVARPSRELAQALTIRNPDAATSLEEAVRLRSWLRPGLLQDEDFLSVRGQAWFQSLAPQSPPTATGPAPAQPLQCRRRLPSSRSSQTNSPTASRAGRFATGSTSRMTELFPAGLGRWLRRFRSNSLALPPQSCP